MKGNVNDTTFYVFLFARVPFYFYMPSSIKRTSISTLLIPFFESSTSVSFGDFPQDATWMSFNGTIRCTSPYDVFLLLKSSDFVTHDLTQP